MPKYSSYPVITEILADDVVLIHQDSSNSEKLISFDNIIASIVDSIDKTIVSANTLVATDANKNVTLHNIDFVPPLPFVDYAKIRWLDGGGIEIDRTAAFDLQQRTAQLVGQTIVMRDAFGTIGASSLYMGGSTFLSSADVVLIHGATSANVVDTLVKRGGTGEIVVGQLAASSSAGGTGQIAATGAMSSSVSVAAPVGSFPDLTAATQLQVGSTVGLRLGPSETNGRIKNWHWHPVSQAFAGGAPSETFDVNITGSGFSSKPDIGFLMAYNPDYLATYQISSGSSTSTNARCELVKRDGTNIVAGTFAIAALFIDL